MSKIKTILAVLVIGLMVCSLSACGKSENMVSGMVKDATMSTVTIETPEGRMLFFPTESADISQAAGMIIGDTVEIYYNGEIKDGNSSEAQVTKVIKTKDAPPLPAPTLEIEAANTLEGVITDATNNTIAIQIAGEQILNFVTLDAEKVSLNGYALGDMVKVSYIGEINGEDTTAAQVVKIEIINEAPQPSTEAP